MPLPDSTALLDWLARRLPDVGAPLTLRRFGGGQSNPTYALDMPRRRLVLRAKPGGPLLPSAHQIEREFRVLRALEETAVPVPRVLLQCDDPAVWSTPFYIMEFLDGRVFADPALPGRSPDERRAMYASAFSTLAELHRVDFRAVGLGDYGRAEGYLARQVGRWTKQYRASQTEAIPSMEALIAWLPGHLPGDDEAAIAHGDYRLGNLLFAPDESRVSGVLDWELSTIGHPLLDLAYALLMQEAPADIVRGMGGSGSAAIMQGIRQRIILGNAAGGAEAQAKAVLAPLFADAGWRVAQGAVVADR
jgi:aminoglycoside phosphotransferase (APT) family kinase protein